MNGMGDPGKFLTSSITSSGMKAGGGILGGGAKGAITGGLTGAMIGGLPGAAIGAGLGATLGSLSSVSKSLTGVWESLIGVSKKLIDIYAAFSPILQRQRTLWQELERNMNRVWAKTIAPLVKDLSEYGMRFKKAMAGFKIESFKTWEGTMKAAVVGLKSLGEIAIKLGAIGQIFGKLLSTVLTPVFKVLSGLIGLVNRALKKIMEFFGFVFPEAPRQRKEPGPPSRGAYGEGEEGAKKGRRRFEDLGDRLTEYGPKPAETPGIKKPSLDEVSPWFGPPQEMLQRLFKKWMDRDKEQKEMDEKLPEKDKKRSSVLSPSAAVSVKSPSILSPTNPFHRRAEVEDTEAVEPEVLNEEEKEVDEIETEDTASPPASVTQPAATVNAGGTVNVNVLDSTQLLDLIEGSWSEIKWVLKNQQAEYELLKYRLAQPGSYV